MADPHAIRDEITRNRVDLINNLNKLFELDPDAGKTAYELSLTHIAQYFKGTEPSEDVEEKGDVE